MAFSWHTLAVMAIMASGYALSESSLLQLHGEHQATKKVDLPNRINAEAYGMEGVAAGTGTSASAGTGTGTATGPDIAAAKQRKQRRSPSEPLTRSRLHLLKDESRQKRSQRDLGDYKDLNDIMDELEDNNSVGPAAEFDFENMPPLTYYLLLQKLRQLQSNEPLYRVRTPRLGRSIDFQLLDGYGGGAVADGGDESGISRQFVSSLMKKSVPFKPRLGKRAPQCE